MDILAQEERVFEIIKDELRDIREKYASPRLTQLVPDEGEINMEDLIANEGMHHHHHARRLHQAHRRQRLPRAAARRQRRHRHDDARRRDAKRTKAISSSISSPRRRTIT